MGWIRAEGTEELVRWKGHQMKELEVGETSRRLAGRRIVKEEAAGREGDAR